MLDPHQSQLKLHRITLLSVLIRISLVQILAPGSPFQICPSLRDGAGCLIHTVMTHPALNFFPDHMTVPEDRRGAPSAQYGQSVSAATPLYSC